MVKVLEMSLELLDQPLLVVEVEVDLGTFTVSLSKSMTSLEEFQILVASKCGEILVLKVKATVVFECNLLFTTMEMKKSSKWIYKQITDSEKIQEARKDSQMNGTLKFMQKMTKFLKKLCIKK